MKVDVAIVGAGLSGLHTACRLNKLGISFQLLEARDRLGGRILSQSMGDANQLAFDLGPSWFWPGQQYMHDLIQELDLLSFVFPQSSQGAAIYEDAQGVIRHGIDGLSMQGAYRIKGGMRKIINALAGKIPNDSIQQQAIVKQIVKHSDHLEVNYAMNGTLKSLQCQTVVLAIPPRVAIQLIEFTPAYSEQRLKVLNNISTWMAGHEKYVAVYDKPFWVRNGFSGDAFSHRGPLQEIHDASLDEVGPYALFGFSGMPPKFREQQRDEFQQAAIKQLVRLFGEQAADTQAIYFKNWASDEFTATDLDQEILKFHPQNNIETTTEEFWNEKLVWAGTEAASPQNFNNGFLEGALEASHSAVSLLTAKHAGNVGKAQKLVY